MPFQNQVQTIKLKPCLRALLWVFGFSLSYIGITCFITYVILDCRQIVFDKYIGVSSVIYLFLFFGFLYFYPVYVMVFIRPDRLFKEIARGYSRHLLRTDRLIFSIPVIIIIPIVYSVYSSFKRLIPEIHYFQFDAVFCSIDRSLFVGVAPWQLLQPIIGYPWVTVAVDWLYHDVWLYMLLLMVLWHAQGKHSLKIRVRFFVSYILVWAIIGNLLAVLMSSAGPCYFDRITGLVSPYKPLFDYLQKINNYNTLSSLVLQEKLWSGFAHNYFDYGGGISAMPSLHVATSTLFALSARNISPLLSKLLFIYASIVLIGSVHLGWHYAVDGLFSVPCTILIWCGVGRMLNRDSLLKHI
jgi:hypothetical protein